MEFIQRVAVKDFRSLPGVSLAEMGDIAPLIGANGSGKSNVFRALNLFFNDIVEDGDPLDLKRDFREPGRRQKLQISVEVDLAFGAGLRKEFQSALDEVADGASDVTFRKTYSLDHLTDRVQVGLAVGRLGTELKPTSDTRRALAERLLSAVRFRYVPNHLHPSQLLLHEEDNIRRMLFSRLGAGKGFDESQMALMKEKAQNLMAPIEEAMKAATGDVDEVELDTPGGWKDLVWAFGLKLRSGQAQSYEAVLQGSGVQSVLAYSVLALIDTSFGGTFGWRVGTVWAIEEPESFLHADLQAALARRLNEYARGQRLQVLLTTHSQAFLGVSDHGYAVTMDGAGRTSIERQSRAVLTRVAQSSGVTSFAHPLHTGPPKPMLLVEGKDDRALLNRAYLASSEPCPYDIISLEDLEDGLSGGVEQIRSYLHYNKAALRARPNESPVIVLLDWEVQASRESKINEELAEHPTSVCVRMPEDASNQDLSQEFVGIEGFLSTSFYEAAAEPLDLSLTQPVSPTEDQELGIKRSELKARKPAIHKLLAQRDEVADIQLLVDLLPWINSFVAAGKQLAMTP